MRRAEVELSVWLNGQRIDMVSANEVAALQGGISHKFEKLFVLQVPKESFAEESGNYFGPSDGYAFSLDRQSASHGSMVVFFDRFRDEPQIF